MFAMVSGRQAFGDFFVIIFSFFMKRRARARNILVRAIVAVYLLYGLYQFSYVLDLLRRTGVGIGLDVVVSGLLSYTPVIGTAAAMLSSISLYKTSAARATFMFLPIIFVQLLVLLVLFIGFLRKIKKKGDV